MKLKIELAMDNAAFEGNWQQEAARILEDVAEGLECGIVADGHKLKDVNGNVVGKVEIEPT